MSDVITATNDDICGSCGRGILKGSKCRTDGSRAWHMDCAAPKAVGAPMAAGPVAAKTERPRDEEGKLIFVEIGAWVPVDRVEILLEAIRRARA
jgi:hypothetical protein